MTSNPRGDKRSGGAAVPRVRGARARRRDSRCAACATRARSTAPCRRGSRSSRTLPAPRIARNRCSHRALDRCRCAARGDADARTRSKRRGRRCAARDRTGASRQRGADRDRAPRTPRAAPADSPLHRRPLRSADLHGGKPNSRGSMIVAANLARASRRTRRTGRSASPRPSRSRRARPTRARSAYRPGSAPSAARWPRRRHRSAGSAAPPGLVSGPSKIEHRAHAERGADRRQRLHRRMKIGREQEREPGCREALRRPLLIERQREAELLDQIGAAAAAR